MLAKHELLWHDVAAGWKAVVAGSVFCESRRAGWELENEEIGRKEGKNKKEFLFRSEEVLRNVKLNVLELKADVPSQ